MPSDFQLLQTLLLSDIRTVVTFENIPASLILNWDHTGLHYVIIDIERERITESPHYSY